jgi:hypothetical protein
MSTSNKNPPVPCFGLLTSALIGLLLLLFSGCTTHQNAFPVPADLYVAAKRSSADYATDFAPVFVLPEPEKSYNRIGKVVAQTTNGNEHITIDPDQPVIYCGRFTFSTGKGTYINQVFRVHFQNIPFSLVPFHLAAGNNIGLLVIVTLNTEQVPLLVTTVNTCGCYAGVIPTGSLSPGAYPGNWNKKQQSIYGEILPGSLPAYTVDDVLLVTVRPEVHRVMDVRVVKRSMLSDKKSEPADMLPLQSLKMLPLASGMTTSLYYDTWPLRGHVKGSIKPWESLLLSLVSLDFYVGMDKEYGTMTRSGNPFYTSLLPWNRQSSDMNNFAGFLKFWGWRL